MTKYKVVVQIMRHIAHYEFIEQIEQREKEQPKIDAQTLRYDHNS